jgi:signal transduction histidine kinase
MSTMSLVASLPVPARIAACTAAPLKSAKCTKQELVDSNRISNLNKNSQEMQRGKCKKKVKIKGERTVGNSLVRINRATGLLVIEELRDELRDLGDARGAACVVVYVSVW